MISVRDGPLFFPSANAHERAHECPFCGAGLAHAAGAERLRPEALLLAVANNPWWRPQTGLCDECAAGLEHAHDYVQAHAPQLGHCGVPILPTPVRLGAPEGRSGRGVTVAFLDSGFFAHPDLVRPRSRILAYVDVNDPRARPADLERPDVSSWHGMMTSVVACGNGWLSGGLYRGLASRREGRARKGGDRRAASAHDDIRRGLEWVMRNRKRYGIRVVNVSCGGDYEASYLEDGLSQAAEAATRAGLLVVAAAGNLGDKPGHPVLPPASSPSVLTVGGLDDQNRLPFSGYDMYHSSYGPTLDGLQKPEVIAPGIWVAAPILPGTPTAGQAALLARLASARTPELARAGRGDPGDGRRPRRGARRSSRRCCASSCCEDPRPQRDLRRLQARRRHELRRAHRVVARGAAARGRTRLSGRPS